MHIIGSGGSTELVDLRLQEWTIIVNVSEAYDIEKVCVATGVIPFCSMLYIRDALSIFGRSGLLSSFKHKDNQVVTNNLLAWMTLAQSIDRKIIITEFTPSKNDHGIWPRERYEINQQGSVRFFHRVAASPSSQPRK